MQVDRPLVTGLAEGRAAPDQLTPFWMVDTALADVACLLAVAEEAQPGNTGVLIEG
jgi:ornithine cyclodeaminase/alanine dehydrogenase-like protein (mu-crystallin family)